LSSEFLTALRAAEAQELVPDKFRRILRAFYDSYKLSLPTFGAGVEHTFTTYLRLVGEQCSSPFQFSPFHQQIRKPFDYYAFGLDFLRPLVDKSACRMVGKERWKLLAELQKKGHNIVLLANHQIEADPQAIGLLLEDINPKFASDIIFVAGERVLTDPLAIPFSLGCNLLCIYSKKYMDQQEPEERLRRQLYNKKTMEMMAQLLSEGGKCIYVAPSGGRDRKNEQGEVEVAPFDAQSIEMFYLMARRSHVPTHFFPLTLSTYELLPPPDRVQKELGEPRRVAYTGIGMALGEKCNMEALAGSDGDKRVRREARAHAIWQQVVSAYKQIG